MDFNRYGISDVLWHDPATGDTGCWLADPTGQVGFTIGNGSTSYQIAAVGDYYGDGFSDVLRHDSTTGDTGYWTTDAAGRVARFLGFGTGGNSYSIIPA